MAPIVVVPFNVMEDSVRTFIGDLRDKLAIGSPCNVKGHPVLAKRPGRTEDDSDELPPVRWIYVKLQGDDGAAPMVAIRDDNAYIVGFTNGEGRWFQFTNKKKTVILPDPKATLLVFSGHYNQLVGDVDVNLPKLKLGKFKTSRAATALWNHRQKKAFDDDDSLGGDPMASLKRALATLAVTFCEAARLIPVQDVISGGWEDEDGVSITAQQVKYITKWGQLSKALLGWDRDGDDGTWFKSLKKSTGISNGKQALEVVQLLLNNPPDKKTEPVAEVPVGTSGEEAPAAGEKTEAQAGEDQKPKSSAILNPL